MMYDQQIDSRGYLVYKNRYNDNAEQDNPNLLYILFTINEKYAGSRYSTYRCAGKLYSLQKALYTFYIPFEVVNSILNRHQLNLIDSTPSIKPSQLTGFVHDVYFAATRLGYFDDLTIRPNLEAISALLAGLLWAVFDPKRTTAISVLELRQTFVLLCEHATHAQMVWEHFRLTCDHNMCVSRHRFDAMLLVLSKLLTFLGEPDHLRSSMVQQITHECFANYPGLVGMTEYQFSCLWKLSSLFSYYSNVVSLNKRLHDTEQVTHCAMCIGCRSVIRGLRFKCQRCRDVSLCIDCFTTGYGNKRHNMTHKMYEISSGDVERSSCTTWLSKMWQWLKTSGYPRDMPSPSTYENLEAKLIDTKAVELMSEGNSNPVESHEPRIKESTLPGTLSRTTSSTMKRNMSLFSNVEYNAFNNTQQKQLLVKLATATEALEEHYESGREQLAACLKQLSAEERTSMSTMHTLFADYLKKFADHLGQLKDINTQMGQGMPQCSSTPYRSAECTNHSTTSKPENDANKSYTPSAPYEQSNLSVRDISTWFHIDVPAPGGPVNPHPSKTTMETKKPAASDATTEVVKPKEQINPGESEDELSYRIERLKMDTQMTNFRDLLLKVREIIDDSYCDNVELARSTKQIEKTLDRIIAEEEKKRKQQYV